MGLLREPLSDDQLRLLHVIFDPFSQSGEWPVWQYADLMLERDGVDAADALASLPQVGEHSPVTLYYGLTWREDSYIGPRHDSRVALTVAGLRYLLPGTEPLLGAFMATVRHMVDHVGDCGHGRSPGAGRACRVARRVACRVPGGSADGVAVVVVIAVSLPVGAAGKPLAVVVMAGLVAVPRLAGLRLPAPLGGLGTSRPWPKNPDKEEINRAVRGEASQIALLVSHSCA